MLRIIVISLFVANLLLLGFQAGKPEVETETAASVAAMEDSGIPTIHLFSELVKDQDLMAGSRQCFTIGPFHGIKDMQAVRDDLLEVALNTQDRQTQALVEKGYWVFLRPYRSLLEANEELFALQALGLKDVAVVFEGEFRNSVSLGYFLRQENALKRQQALRTKGYEPLVRVQRSAEPRYWLDYEQNPGSSVMALNMQDRPNDFMQRSMPCPEQAGGDSGAIVQEPDQAESATPEQGLPDVQLQASEPVANSSTGGAVDGPQAGDGEAPADG